MAVTAACTAGPTQTCRDGLLLVCRQHYSPDFAALLPSLSQHYTLVFLTLHASLLSSTQWCCYLWLAVGWQCPKCWPASLSLHISSPSDFVVLAVWCCHWWLAVFFVVLVVMILPLVTSSIFVVLAVWCCHWWLAVFFVVLVVMILPLVTSSIFVVLAIWCCHWWLAVFL